MDVLTERENGNLRWAVAAVLLALTIAVGVLLLGRTC